MAFSYGSIEKQVDKENRKKEKEKRKNEQRKKLEEAIEVITEEPWEDDLTALQMFLINYFGIQKENVKNNNLDINNYDIYISDDVKISADELEVQRYNALIDILALIPWNVMEFANESKDIFHKEVKNWDDFTDTIGSDELIVKKMRNLQLLNMLAHTFQSIYRSIINKAIGLDEIYSDIYIKRIWKMFKGLCSPLNSESEHYMKILQKTYDSKILLEIKENHAIKNVLALNKWMYKQKSDYLLEILKDLQETDKEYNYGKAFLEENGRTNMTFIFDVPGYGQFSVHRTPRDNRLDDWDDVVQEYNGDFLEYGYLMYKADEELVRQADPENLSDKEKQLYNIIKQEEIWRKKEQYQKVRKTSSEIKQNQESLNTIKLSLKSLKKDKEILKKQIKENEEKMLRLISENDENKEEIVQSIKELQEIIKQQKAQKERIKKDREELKGTKESLKKAIMVKESSLEDSIDELEL